jgi:hypothetical protein
VEEYEDHLFDEGAWVAQREAEVSIPAEAQRLHVPTKRSHATPQTQKWYFFFLFFPTSGQPIVARRTKTWRIRSPWHGARKMKVEDLTFFKVENSECNFSFFVGFLAVSFGAGSPSVLHMFPFDGAIKSLYDSTACV